MSRTEAVNAGEEGGWLSFAQPKRLAIRRYTANIEGLPSGLDGFRFLHISDLHLTRRWHEAYEDVIARVAELDVDMVLCTGDIVDDKRTHVPAMPTVLRLLPALRSRLGTYTILGNHDSEGLGEELASAGINVLNGRRVVDTGGGEVELIGTPGLFRPDLPVGFARQMPPREAGVPRVVMAHYPDRWAELKSLDPDVFLCGHTHGGQVCLPGGWLIMRHDSSPRKYCRGCHQRGRTFYLVSHGFGVTGLALRLFCPPEVGVVTLGCHA